jgi:ElaB/YqjD/DUF883 family membrane-anchored ribosome-binding protein
MTHEEKVQYFEMAAAIVGFRFQDKDLDLLVRTYDAMLEKGGETSLEDLVSIRVKNNELFKKEEPKEEPKQEAPTQISSD